MFHVPEGGRIIDGTMGTERNAGLFGAFTLPSPEPGWTLYLICDDGDDPDMPTGWEHVSVHAKRDHKLRTPTWKEMVAVKQACWDDDDVVIQFHPRASEYVNRHPHVLHLWRHRELVFPTPPKELVG